MKHQTDGKLQHYINKYGCFFMCMIYWLAYKKDNRELSYEQLNTLWNDAIKNGIISGDLNHDGDMDDSNELLILDKDKLLSLAGIKLKYIGSYMAHDYVKKEGQFYIGEFYNERTKFTHFIAVDENLKIVYDPIQDSVTGREGKIQTVRIRI